MTARLRIGCASWADKSFLASGWYPEDCKNAEDRLHYYASRFRVVEVDSAYYALPSRRNAERWRDRTSEDFVFNIKAFRLFTGHWTPPEALPKDIRAALPGTASGSARLFYKDVPQELVSELWRRYKDALAPLHESSQLGTILFQFPAAVKPHATVFDHITYCQERLAPYQLAVEFRNREWFTEGNEQATFDFLRAHNLSFVAVDEPQGYASSVPPVVVQTGPHAIVRFHGRNATMWEKTGLSTSAERFNYYYTTEEFSMWVPIIRSLLEGSAREVHIIMNTNNGDQGPANALLLANLLGDGIPGTGHQNNP